MNEANLAKLADYLAALPGDYRHFDMTTFRNDGARGPSTAPFRCGTVACALGHAPCVCPEFAPIGGNETWDGYCARLFGVRASENEWDWCFGGSWYDVDNTPQGAALRIRWLLTHGEAPDDMNEQIEATAPLCYVEEPAE